MNIEELEQPRYKVIADYPNRTLELNQIVTPANDLIDGWYSHYPHLFKKLKWWEERDVADMPEYVKVTDKDGVRAYKQVYKMKDETIYYNQYCYGIGIGWLPIKCISGAFPATLEEYNNYQKQITVTTTVCDT